MMEIILTTIFTSLSLINLSWLYLFFKPDKRYTTKNLPDVSIIVPAHNEANYISETIHSLLNSKYPEEIEIVIVNDGSTDKTKQVVDKIAKVNPKVKLYNVKHQGKANAINFGVKHAKYDTIVTLDADSTLAEGSLEELVKPLNEKNVAATSGIIRAKVSNNPLTWFQDLDYFFTSGWRYVSNKANATFILPGFAAFKKEIFLDTNGFSTDTLTEDFDIALRIRKMGYNAVMTKAKILTKTPTTFKQLFEQRFRWGRGTIQVAKKHSDVFFSKYLGALGYYSMPIQIYWYLLSLFYLPSIFYWMFSEYQKYFSSYSIFSSEVFMYFFKWFTSYGPFDLIYNILIGAYQYNFVLLLTVVSFMLSISYFLLLAFKFSNLSWKHALAYFFLFPYNLIIFFIQSFALLYEIGNKSKVYNRWHK